MGAVAADQDVSLEREVDAADEERSAAEARVGGNVERSLFERLVLRYVTWDLEHPHNPYMRLQNAVSYIYFRLGLGRSGDDMLLTTTGRKSGLPRHAPMGAFLIDGRLYAFNPFGERAHWFRNLTVDPIVTVYRRGRTWTARATRVVDHDEAIALYEKMPGATGTGLRWLLRVQGIAETAENVADSIDKVYFVRFDEVDEAGPPSLKTDLVWVWPAAGVMGALGWLASRRLGVAVATGLLAIPALIGAALGYGRIEVHGTHPEGRWARLFAAVGPRLTWWLYDAFEEALELQPDDEVLDVACGCGTFLNTRCSRAHRIAGIDQSVTLIEIARRESLERVDAGASEFVVGDVTELPWEEGTFSVVTSNDVGCYEEKAQPAIEEMYRVLRKGGRAVLADDRHELMEAAGFAEVTVEPFLRFGHITRGIKP